MFERLKTGIVGIAAALGGLVLLVGTTPAHAEWLKAETEHFIIIGDTSDSAIRNYARKVERFDGLLRLWFPPKTDVIPPKLTIYLADGRDDMREIWPTIQPNVGGFYAVSDSRIFAVTGGSGRENDHTLFHEYGHHYMHQYMPEAYPGWYVEGFAEFFATADLTPNRMRVGLHSDGRMNSLTGGANTWLPMETILRSRPLEMRGKGHAFYAQSWLLTHYFLSTSERREALARYLAAVLAGGDPVTSLEPTIGLTPAQLQSEVHSYMSRINFASEQRQSPTADVTVTPLPASAPDLVWLDLRLARYVPEAARAANLNEAQGVAARFPGDIWAARVLAQAHLDMKQPAEAVQALNTGLATTPDDADALRMKAEALMDQGDLTETTPEERTAFNRQARQTLARAYQLDAMDYRLYLALDRSRQGAAGYPTDNDVETLITGWSLAPQVSNLSVRTAQALMAKERYAAAARLLGPIANNPHGGSGLAPIRRLLAEAREKAGMPSLQSAEDAAAEATVSDNTGADDGDGPEDGEQGGGTNGEADD